jgi:hypothetical protein
MKLTTALVAVLGACKALAASVAVTKRDPSAFTKYCSPTTGLCYNEYLTNSKFVYLRIAIPDSAIAAPYDIAIQIVAPRTTGWVAVSWGGTMINSPLTIGWRNGNNVTVSSRSAR